MMITVIDNDHVDDDCAKNDYKNNSDDCDDDDTDTVRLHMYDK